MLVNLVLNALYALFELLFSAVNLPHFSSDMLSFIDTFLEYLRAGVLILANYIDLTYISILFSAFISLYLAYDLYKLVMWVLRKIPMLGIE